MKKLISTLLVGSILYATTTSTQAAPLIVNIRNFGSENCVLKKKYIIQGYIYQNEVPSVLSDSGEVYTFKMNGGETEAQVSYQCGTYKKFTLYMHQYAKRRHRHTSIDAKMVDSVDIFEKHTTQVVWRDSQITPGVVSWQISH